MKDGMRQRLTVGEIKRYSVIPQSNATRQSDKAAGLQKIKAEKAAKLTNKVKVKGEAKLKATKDKAKQDKVKSKARGGR